MSFGDELAGSYSSEQPLGGNVLLYLTSAGSKAKAVRGLGIKKGELVVAGRTGLVVASHCEGMKRKSVEHLGVLEIKESGKQ